MGDTEISSEYLTDRRGDRHTWGDFLSWVCLCQPQEDAVGVPAEERTGAKVRRHATGTA